jgi:TPR repeat protein
MKAQFLTALLMAALGAGSALAGPAEDVLQAEAYIRTGDVYSAMALLRKAADQNNPAAQARLADLLHAAEFDAEALVLYRKAAAQGEPAGETGLGRMYADGTGVPRDAALALEWYRKAEQKNYPPALDALARAYRTGSLGLAKDADHAKELDTRARAPAQPKEAK